MHSNRHPEAEPPPTGPAQRTDAVVIAYAQGIIRWRWAVLLITLFICGLCTYGFRYFVFNDDYRVFFAKTDPRLQAYESVQNAFTKNDSVLFIVTAKDGEIFDRRVLEAIAYLTEEAWKLPNAIRVDSLANFQHTWSEGDDLFVEALIRDPATISDAALAKAKHIALHEPMLLNRIVKPDSPVTGVNVTVHLPGLGPGEAGPCALASKALAHDVETRFPEVTIALTGVIPLNYAFLEATKHDLWNLAPIMVVIIIATMLLLLRSPALTAATVAVVVLSSTSAVGIVSWLGYEITGPVSPSPLIILTLAVAGCIHILVSMQWHMRHGHSKHACLVEALRVNMQPVFLTCLTTGFGFLSMNINAVPPVRLMGNTVALGVAISFFLCMTFLPALVAIIPLRPYRHADDARSRSVLERLAEWVIRHKHPLVASQLVLTVLAAIFVPQIRINNQFIEWFEKDVPIRRDTEYAMEHLSGIYHLTFSAGAKDSGGICEPEYFQQLERFTGWLEQQPGVVHVSSLVDTIKRVNKSMYGDDPAMYRIPESRELAAQYLLLYEMSLPYGLDLNTEMNVDKSATRVVVTLANLRSEELLVLAARAEEWQRENLPAYIYSDAMGPGVMFAHISRNVMHSMMISSPLALILVSMSLLAALRSIGFGLLSLIPNLMPLAMGFGVWGLLRWDMNFSMSTIAAMSIGIVVDDTVHFMSKYLRARREKGLNSEDAVRYAFASVGKAMWVTSFILVAGFSVATLSYMQFGKTMGTLTSMIIIFALAGDLLLLPALLLCADVRGRTGTKTLEELRHEEEALVVDA